jgi:hypothetical protein
MNGQVRTGVGRHGARHIGPGRSLAEHLNFGTTTGWALCTADRTVRSGTVSFRPSRYDGGGMRYRRFANWLAD